VRLYENFQRPNGQVELHLEVALGSALAPRLPLSFPQSLNVIRQCLSALAYLHGQSPPIAHRDIKPENILVNDTPSGIHIKLADFGLSREARDLKTLCGTPTYLAPELWASLSQDGTSTVGYSPAVDVWSLGVVAAQCVNELPPRGDGPGPAWCERLVRHLRAMIKRSRRSQFYTLLSRRMVLLDPTARATAPECHDEVMELQERVSQRELYTGLESGDDDDDMPLTDVEEVEDVEDEDEVEPEADSGTSTPRATRSVAEDVEALKMKTKMRRRRSQRPTQAP
jgi:serine/threonine protein kinase